MALTQVSTGGVKDGTILNADINASAAIAGTKISPSFTSDIILTNANPSISLIDSDANSDFKINVNGGIFSIKDQTNVDATRLGINSSGNVFVGGSSSVGTKLHIENASGDAHIRLRGSSNYGVLFTRHSDAALTGYVGSGNAVNLGTSNVALSAPLSGGDIIFQTNGTAATDEKMRIAADGLVTVSGDLAVTSSLAKIKLNDTDGGDQFQIRNDGGNFKIRNSTDGRDDINITNNNLTLGGVLTIQDNNSIFFGASQDIEMRHNATSGQNQIISKNHDFLLQSADSIYFQILASGNSNNQAILTLQNTAITSYRDIRIDRGTAGIDGIVGQAYAGYFGLKHADQTINSEYMMLSNNSHTFISCTSGYNIYIRPSANSQVHQTVFAHNVTQFKTNILMDGHALARNQHQWGHLEGSYNNVGNNSNASNPIYTIGSSYNPNQTDLNTAGNGMFGIGFSHGSASFLPTSANWGLYAAANGIAKVFLDAGNGRLYFSNNIVSTPRFISAPTGDYGSMQINNGATSGWRGYSIDGHSVFMSNGTNAVTNYIGIYDDNVNQWAILHARTAWVRLYYGSGLKFETTNAGVYIHGTLTATSTKSFRIPHPLSELSETKDLVHAAIEGPQMDLMYRGKVDLVNGTAVVNIDTKSGMTEGTFDVLNRDVQCFTTNETGWTNVKGSVTGNKLTIVAEDNSCTDTISWMVIGERKDNGVVSSEVTNDNGDLIVEPDKQVIDDDPKMDD